MATIAPCPHNLSDLGKSIGDGACVKPELLSELLMDSAKEWHADQEKIAYLESLLLRK